MDLFAFLSSFRRHWPLIALCVVIGAGVGAVSTRLRGGPSARTGAPERRPGDPIDRA